MNLNRSPDWKAMIRSGDAKGLADAAGQALGVTLPAAAFLAACRLAQEETQSWSGPLGEGHGSPWSAGTWIVWLKNRADSLNCYRSKTTPTEQLWGSVRLNVGFMHVEETPEHMEILRRPDPDGESPKPKAARSKIGKTEAVIRPIDRTAARVAPKTERAKRKKEQN